MNYYPHCESSTLELKREIPKHDQIIKTLIGFCNQHGGKLVIGVQDDRKVCGLSDKEIDEILNWAEKAVYEASTPPIIPKVSIQRIGDQAVLELEVSSGMNKPYYRNSEGIEKGTYIRLGRNTVRASPEMIEELRWKSRGLHYEETPLYRVTIDSIKISSVQKFLQKRKNRGEDECCHTMLLSYGLAINEQAHTYPTVAGMLLFGENPQRYITEGMIICTHFRGTEGRDIVATVDCEGTLFDQFLKAFDFILTQLTRSVTFDGPQRKEDLEIPEKAVREALLNAIVHRNYHLLAPIKVAIWSDRVEIFSPGGFPGPISTNNLRTGRSYLRNPNICKVFREAGYVEKLGSGFIVILDSYEAAGLPKPQVVDGGDYVKCILSRPSTIRAQVPEELLASKVLALFDQYQELRMVDMVKILGLPRSTLSRTVSQLVEQKLLNRIGKTRAVRYSRRD